MPTATAIFFLPISGNVTPTANLVSNITMKPSCSALPAYEVTQHLYVNTSSLLPQNAKPAPREHHQILTVSQDRSKTYVGLTKPPSKPPQATGKSEATMITIPTQDRESYMQLLATKMQPLWAHRQSLFIDKGRSVRLGDNQFVLRLGDLRMTGKNKSESTVRGVLFEMSLLQCGIELGTAMTDADGDMKMLRALIGQLAREVNVKLDNMKVLGRYTEDLALDGDEKSSGPFSQLAELYMEFFRTMRS